MRKILIAIDGSPNALKAVGYMSKTLCSCKEFRITLFHVLPNIPAGFWDDGHILTEKEKKERHDVVEKWMSNHASKLEPVFNEAKQILLNAGVKDEAIILKSMSHSTDTADSIVEEARTGGYELLVMSRSGHSNVKHRMGTVTEKVVRLGAGITISMVE